MLVTINTDASFHSRLKVGSYAYWIVSNQGLILRSGELKGVVENSTQAEVMCIANALFAVKHSKIHTVSKIIINTDCLHFNRYMANHLQEDATCKIISRLYVDLVKKYNLKKGWLEIRHIKAHTEISNANQYVNDWCDRQAKKHIGLLIKRLAS